MRNLFIRIGPTLFIFVLQILKNMSYIKMTAVFEPCLGGGFIAYIPEIPGINTQGETIEEAKENLTDAINLMFEERRAKINPLGFS